MNNTDSMIKQYKEKFYEEICPSKIRNRLKIVFKDFKSCKADSESYLRNNYKDFIIQHSTIDAQLIYYFLHTIFDYPFFGREEKTAWTVPFRYKNILCNIKNMKIYIHLYIETKNFNDNDLDVLFNNIKRCFTKAIEEIQKAYQEKWIEKLNKGECYLDNAYPFFLGLYHFYRKMAKHYVNQYEKDRILFFSGQAKNKFLPTPGKGFYFTYSMIESYFSYLEHLLILLLPFSDYDPKSDKIKLKDILSINWNWESKFKKIFNLSLDKNAHDIFNKLKKIKKRYRNPFSHGAFRYDQSTIRAVTWVGILPYTISDTDNAINFTHPISYQEFNEICDAFNLTDKLVSVGKYSKAMIIIRNGLPLSFLEFERDKYRYMMQLSPVEIKRELNINNYYFDQGSNYEW